MKQIILGFGVALACVGPSMSNDTVAEIGAGGIHYIYTGEIQMVREDLYISADEVRVDYVFRNITDHDVTTLVAFPMPDISTDPYSDIGLPFREDNFLGFSVSVDGVKIEPALQQRASVVGVDITSALLKRNISLFPDGREVMDDLERQAPGSLNSLIQSGAVAVETYDAGGVMKDHYSPAWTMHSTYYWENTFPAGKDLHVSHRYTPAVGATTGLSTSFYENGTISADYARRYCVDDGFVRAARRRIDSGTQFFENWISYILVTGRNWAGNIGTFHLTVDKGSTDNLVSFCAEGLTKTGPTTFELTIEDYYPERDLEILLLEAVDF